MDSGERGVQNLEYRVKFRVECRVYVLRKIGATEEVSPVTHRALPLSTGNLGWREQAKGLITSSICTICMRAIRLPNFWAIACVYKQLVDQAMKRYKSLTCR